MPEQALIPQKIVAAAWDHPSDLKDPDSILQKEGASEFTKVGFHPHTFKFLVPFNPLPTNGLGILSATSPGGVLEASVGPFLD